MNAVVARIPSILLLCATCCISGGGASLGAAGIPAAMCRSSCLEKYTAHTDVHYRKANNMGCTVKANWKCNMCWDYCGALAAFERSRAEMCGDDICMEGCKHACRFFQQPSHGTRKGVLKLSLLKTVDDEIAWSYACNVAEKPVFIVYGLRPDNVWAEILQTADTRMDSARSFKFRKIKIAAASKSGVIGVKDGKFDVKYSKNHLSSRGKSEK